MIPKTLALDYGTVRVGVAVSRGTLADPLIILPNDADLYSQILNIVQREAVQQVVVGISENVMALKSEAFAETLRKQLTIPVLHADETLSSKVVHEKMLFAKQKKRQGAIDHFAAATFLQEWIDEQE